MEVNSVKANSRRHQPIKHASSLMSFSWSKNLDLDFLVKDRRVTLSLDINEAMELKRTIETYINGRCKHDLFSVS